MISPAHDTAPIRHEERFDEERVAAYLRRNLSDLVGTRAIEFDQFPGGRANLTYRAVAGRTELVLRRAPLGEVARRGHDMRREFDVLSRLWKGYPPAPRAYHYCADADVMGKPFFVMERRVGHVIRDRWPAAWPADHDELRTRTAENLVTALAELHLVDPEAVDLDEFGHPDGFVARQVDGWAKRWEAARTRDLPHMYAAADKLKRAMPAPQRAVILHNDYKLDNTMVSNDGDIVAVFDWDMATRGDPLVDVGTLLAYWSDRDGPTYGVFGEEAVTLAPYLSRREILIRYEEMTGFDLSGIAYYEGLALYRITVIIEQIYARFVAGQTTDRRFASLGPLVPVLAEAAASVLENVA